MRLSEEQRRFLRRVYIFLPLVAAIGIMVFEESGLRSRTQRQVPAFLGSYLNRALDNAPDAWLALTFGCAIGTSFDVARRARLKQSALGWWLLLFTPILTAAQIVACGSFVLLTRLLIHGLGR